MAIALFEHNRIAYEAAVSLLNETGKAAIVHPTGTGKSFIAFKLCEDNPESRICWLSPSAYIYETQLENLKSAADGWQPENVTFLTYAKLMGMTDEEIAELQPDYIILDEFHRCGAEMWGQGVQKLLAAYAATPVLGLSATAIRYLDNQRDMADELFDGNVASEITLGEAIVRGILAAPKYVLSVLSYQKDLERYKARVRRAKSKVVRDEAERYLDALRRALEKADGLDVIFDKHMTERTGKYIVFCANKEHMDTMMDKVPEWFNRIDKASHIYSVYSDDPSASQSFADFKADEDTEHLKLLFCIDALNEGIHVENVSGVILLRPTVSPIIYKQQIGRALAAGKRGNAVIFDVVLNIENLYSIGAVEEEMQIAMTYYRSLGEDDAIINERFRVIDEVRDCIALFEKLNDTLTASWDLMYEKAKDYYTRNGNLEVPYKYKTADGYSLGHWILTQKRVRTGDTPGILSAERIAKLDDIGMVWSGYRDLAWERNFEAAKEYYDTFGNLNVVARYVTKTGLNLGAWIARLRILRKNQSQQRYLTPERIQALDEIGMVWDVADHLWQQYYGACLTYYHAHGNLNIPAKYITADGLRLGVWINTIRSAYHGKRPDYRLLPEQINALDELGMIWDKRRDSLWEKGYTEALEYRRTNGNLDVPAAFRTADGYALGKWISRQRDNSELAPKRKALLDDIGMIWSKPDSWETRYALAKAYYDAHRNLDMPGNYVTGGIWLGKWLNEQQQIYQGKRKGKKLTTAQIEQLNRIGMSWEHRNTDVWEAHYREAKQYFEEHGDLLVPTDYIEADGKNLNRWLLTQRNYRSQGKLTQEQIDRLSSIGMVWKFDDPWEIGFAHAKSYYEEHGNLLVQGTYVCPGGYALGGWILNQRANYAKPDKYRKVSPTQKKRLDEIGMVWSAVAERWEAAYALAEEYWKEHGDLCVPTKYKAPNGYALDEWVRSQREKKAAGTLTQEQIERLDAIGMDWLSPQARLWETRFEICRAYYEEHGNLDMPTTYVTDDGMQLGLWLWRIKKGKIKLSTSGENGNQIKRLESIGIRWRKQPGESAKVGVNG